LIKETFVFLGPQNDKKIPRKRLIIWILFPQMSILKAKE
jgi:hypothetical protein